MSELDMDGILNRCVKDIQKSRTRDGIEDVIIPDYMRKARYEDLEVFSGLVSERLEEQYGVTLEAHLRVMPHSGLKSERDANA